MQWRSWKFIKCDRCTYSVEDIWNSNKSGNATQSMQKWKKYSMARNVPSLAVGSELYLNQKPIINF
jgi:hypothetical protein